MILVVKNKEYTIISKDFMTVKAHLENYLRVLLSVSRNLRDRIEDIIYICRIIGGTPMEQQPIFALDIGTRSVVGVIAEEINNQLSITASVVEEHENRSMMDGQIHDIEEVAKVVKRIKTELENKINQPLTQVAVAAAGRALKTLTALAEEEILQQFEVNKEDVLSLELEAVQIAQKKLLDLQDEDNSQYHCVGYSVIAYFLDGSQIGNLIGQQGKKMSVEIIATFLPRVVVDSLFGVLKRSDLDMTSLTLEPIAASQVVIPPNMRMLNIALVDIGAGTSDIALTANGSIVGYAMVPYAGDEITEEISQQFLLDFDTAEKVKRSLRDSSEIVFTDILGFKYNYDNNHIIDKILPKIEKLAREIGEKIIDLNGKSPQAVICIGGGSLTPKLTEKLAEILSISSQRVAVRGREIINQIAGDSILNGPDAITPLGIAYTAYKHNGLSFANVFVNGKQISFFEINQGTTGDALLAAGIDIKRLHGRPGMAKTVKLNGTIKIVKGELGTSARIKINDNIANLNTQIHDNDRIEIMEAIDGEPAKGVVRDILPNYQKITISINGEYKEVSPFVTMNGLMIDIDEAIVDGAEIIYKEIDTIGDALEALDWSCFPPNWVIYRNGDLKDMSDSINNGDSILIIEEEKEKKEIVISNSELPVTISNRLPMLQENKQITSIKEDNVNEIKNLIEENVVVKNAEITNDSFYKTTIFVNGDRVSIPDNKEIIFVDIFSYVNGFEAKPPKVGAVLVMQVNGIKAEFTTPLKNNDRIQLYWKN